MRKPSCRLSIAFFLTAASADKPPVDPTLVAAPLYQPAVWNRDFKVQGRNNCYAYAANDIDTVEFGAYPGYRTTGHNFPKTYSGYASFIKQLINGAKRDGMVYAGKSPLSRPGFYRVALMAHQNPERPDYPAWHWLRQDRNGQWSHKDGSGEAMNVDYAGHVINNPEAAQLGLYKLVAYFLVPQGGLDVGSPHEPVTHRASKPAFIMK